MKKCIPNILYIRQLFGVFLGFLQPASSTAHLAISPPILPQQNLSPHTGVLHGTLSGTHNSNANISSVAVGIIGPNNTSGDSTSNGSIALNLQHRPSSNVPVSGTTTGGHSIYGVHGSDGAVAAAAAAAAIVVASSASGTSTGRIGENRVDATCCPVCLRQFDNRWKLERHARVHTGERPFACTRCTKTFTRKEHLTRHELSHDGENCTIMGELFER